MRIYVNAVCAKHKKSPLPYAWGLFGRESGRDDLVAMEEVNLFLVCKKKPRCLQRGLKVGVIFVRKKTLSNQVIICVCEIIVEVIFLEKKDAFV